MQRSIKKTLFILFAFYLVFLFFGFNQIYAAATINYDSSPPQSNRVSDSFCVEVMRQCWNSWAVGQTDCGTACTGGSPWTKHEYDSCYVDPFGEPGDYIAWLPPTSAVYSTADKCSNGSNIPPPEPYLRGGRCDGSIGGIYKTCCSNSGGVSADSCVPITPFSGAPYPPMDGVCPAGSHSVQCGFGGYPACGQAACGPTAPAPPPPPPTCPTQTCTFSTEDLSCSSGFAIINGNGCSGPNCSGCNYQSCLNNGPATGGGTCTTPGTTPPPPPPPH